MRIRHNIVGIEYPYSEAKTHVLFNRFISEDTIEEGIYNIAQEKLKLEQDVTGQEEGKGEEGEKVAKKKDVARLLKAALGVELKEKQIGDVGKVYTELWTFFIIKPICYSL